MDDELRQSTGSTNTTSTTNTTGMELTTGAESAYGCPQPGPETIQVEQVLGAQMAQKVVESDMVVPAVKPDIEQVIDVFVKEVEILSVDVIAGKVIVRGNLAVKVMYVADRPNQPVHAFEQKQIRWTRDIVIDGAMPDMKATADVTVEYIDYDFDEDENREVHVTVVLKIWARVISTMEMDIYALSPVEEYGQGENYVPAPYYGGEAVTGMETGVPAVNGTTPAATGTATVIGNNVNVRTGPGTNFPVVTKVNNGDVVTLMDAAFGWNKVVLADGVTTGWIAGWLLSNGITSPKG